LLEIQIPGFHGWAWKLTPVISAIQEAEIRRIIVQVQLRKKVSETPSQQKKSEHGGMHLSPLLLERHKKLDHGSG
jgi:hypothetical protein